MYIFYIKLHDGIIEFIVITFKMKKTWLSHKGKVVHEGSPLKVSVLWRHCREIHNNERKKFTMNKKETFGKDSMLRQISESVMISQIENYSN